MSLKQSYCYRILKSYSFLVDFEGRPPRENVFKPKDGETFKKWKERILGDDVTDVVLYTPSSPAPQTKISTLQNSAEAKHLTKIFNTFARDNDRKKTQAVESAVNQTELDLKTFPKNTLEDLLDEQRGVLEPSVKEFFERFLDGAGDNINTEELLTDLIGKYNNTVKNFRDRSGLA